jgi:beta-fructofuranosidase
VEVFLEAHEIRKRLAGDPHRPLYHFLPPHHWMNDPNGLIQWKGQYHLFYQYNPDAPTWGDIHWGHAVSEDLLYWKDLPIALAPSQSKGDLSGCWSGCAINYRGLPTLIYTGWLGGQETVCLATSQDDLLTFQKHHRNPVLLDPPPGIAIAGFRVPYVWKQEGDYYLVIGTGYPGKGGAILLYRSIDIVRWEYLNPLIEWNSLEFGEMWECPNFIPLGDQYLLLVSILGQRRVIYFIGEFLEGKFYPNKSGIFDNGVCYYAPQIFRDEHGRAIVIGWIQEERSDKMQREAEWSGVQSLPRELSLTEEGLLRIEPASEVKKLRQKCYDLDRQDLGDNEEIILEVRGDCLEIQLEMLISKGSSGIKVFCSPDGEEQTVIGFDTAERRLFINRQHSSLSDQTVKDNLGIALDLQEGESLSLRIFVDRSIIEVFVNERWTLTSRVYPERRDSQEIRLFSLGGGIRFRQVKMWKIESVWPSE